MIYFNCTRIIIHVRFYHDRHQYGRVYSVVWLMMAKQSFEVLGLLLRIEIWFVVNFVGRFDHLVKEFVKKATCNIM